MACVAAPSPLRAARPFAMARALAPVAAAGRERERRIAPGPGESSDDPLPRATKSEAAVAPAPSAAADSGSEEEGQNKYPELARARWVAGDDCVAVHQHRWFKHNKLNVFYGTVAAVNADNTLVIDFDDGDVQRDVLSSECRATGPPGPFWLYDAEERAELRAPRPKKTAAPRAPAIDGLALLAGAAARAEGDDDDPLSRAWRSLAGAAAANDDDAAPCKQSDGDESYGEGREEAAPPRKRRKGPKPPSRVRTRGEEAKPPSRKRAKPSARRHDRKNSFPGKLRDILRDNPQLLSWSVADGVFRISVPDKRRLAEVLTTYFRSDDGRRSRDIDERQRMFESFSRQMRTYGFASKGLKEHRGFPGGEALFTYDDAALTSPDLFEQTLVRKPQKSRV